MIKKITPTDYPIADIITKRWSPRVFADTPITEEEAKILLEAGRWAPSSGNMQPWLVFLGIRGTEMYDRIFRCLDDYNQQWAGNSQMLWLNGFRKKMQGCILPELGAHLPASNNIFASSSVI